MDSNAGNDERIRALKFCNKHLGGIWKEVQLSDLEILRLSGGLTNHLYRCTLLEFVKTNNGEPRQVLLRVYGPTHSDKELQLEIFNQLAAEQLGPNLYASFDEGRFEEYLLSSPLSWTNFTNDDISAAVVKKIAAIHRLNVKGLDQGPNWLINSFNDLYEFIETTKKGPSSFNANENVLESTKAIARELNSIDFKPEIEYLARLFARSEAPIVFSHNDLHQNNILLLDNSDKNRKLDDRIVLIDFEYCSYNYRSFDLANYLSEWCFDYGGKEYPYFNASVERFPAEEKQRQLAGHYVSQLSDANFGNGPNNGEANSINGKLTTNDKTNVIFYEMQPFFMASNLLWTFWSIKGAYISEIDFGYWEMAKAKWDVYLFCKERFRKKFGSALGCDEDLFVQSPKM